MTESEVKRIVAGMLQDLHLDSMNMWPCLNRLAAEYISRHLSPPPEAKAEALNPCRGCGSEPINDGIRIYCPLFSCFSNSPGAGIATPAAWNAANPIATAEKCEWPKCECGLSLKPQYGSTGGTPTFRFQCCRYCTDWLYSIEDAYAAFLAANGGK